MKNLNFYKLSSREEQIIHLIAYEHSTQDIANQLYINFETVKSHRKNLFRKLEVTNVAGLVRVAFEKGILQISHKVQFNESIAS